MEFWRTSHRPASYNPNIAIPEKKPVFVPVSLRELARKEAETLVAEMKPVIIGGIEYRSTLIAD